MQFMRQDYAREVLSFSNKEIIKLLKPAELKK